MLAALLMGVAQGLSEFLPISSSGHLALLARLLHSQSGFSLAIAAHVGTLLAVAVAYWPALVRLVREPRGPGGLATYAIALAGTLPLAVLLSQPAESAFSDLHLVALGFLATTLLLLVTRHLPQEGRSRPSNLDALLIGIAQGIAVWPGLSRSGTTIAAGRTLGLTPDAAGEFSFLLMLPTVAGATAREILSGGSGAAPSGDAALCALVSAAVGFAALIWLRGLLRRGRFWQFSLYTLALAGVSFWLR